MSNKQTGTKIAIIGQGLAGTCLSYQLQMHNVDFVVIDNSHVNSASQVAAGLINPIVFKRLTKSWMADELMPYLDQFYPRIEELLNVSFYKKRDLLRVLNTVEEINTWDGKKGIEFDDYLGKVTSSEEFQIPLKKEGNLGVVRAASVDLPIMLNGWKEYLKKRGKLIEEEISHHKILWTNNHAIIELEEGSIKADKVVFCDGAGALNNPLFSWLPFNLSKGDLLTIKNDQYAGREILNNGKFYLPMEDGTIKMGSTYKWDELSYEVTKEGEKELLEKIAETLSGTTKSVDHKVGIRPTVRDRRPFLGRHPETLSAYVFNGLGTKGAMLAPYFSKKMFDYLINDKNLAQEVDIKRIIRFFNGAG
jgi:glycine oxidase